MNGERPSFLPTIIPIAEVQNSMQSLFVPIPDLPPAINQTSRKLLLLRLLMAKGHGARSAIFAADALCSFLDEMTQEEGRLEGLLEIVPQDFAEQWGVTLDFLKILSNAWPLILSDMGLVDAQERSRAALDHLSVNWAKNPPDGKIIAAGSTGSHPATARLLAVVAGLPNGRVVLPNMDTNLHDDEWHALNPAHPSWGIREILSAIGADRCDVKLWPASQKTTPREKFASEIMRPEGTAENWSDMDADFVANSISNLRLFECKNPQEESNLIAILLREALEENGKSAMFVTPDADLAKRVSSVLLRWGIEIDSSKGSSLALSSLGSLALLCALSVIPEKPKRSDILSMLRNSFCNFLSDAEVDEIERNWRSGKADNFELKSCAALKPLFDISKSGAKHPIKDWIAAHIKTLENIAKSDEIWGDEQGNACMKMLDEAQDSSDVLGEIGCDEYLLVISSLIKEVTLFYPDLRKHKRLQILSPMEARLMDADFVILGSVNEGTWPPALTPNPWISSAMRRPFGLPPQEQDVGKSAHDFMQLFCSKNVAITRAARIAGVPSAPSRWLVRLEAALKSAGISTEVLKDDKTLQWASKMDSPLCVTPAKRPSPRPPQSARPSGISVSKVDDWLKNPYAIYAKYILKLRALDDLQGELGAREFGTFLHELMEEFSQLKVKGNAEFSRLIEDKIKHIDAPVFWQIRLNGLAQWVCKNEAALQACGQRVGGLEVAGEIEIIDGFKLQARADRIDITASGGAVIIDYKSGGTFTAKGMKDAKYPQLPLEALILDGGGFGKIQSGTKTCKLEYWVMNSGKSPPKVVSHDCDIDDITTIARDGLAELITTFKDEKTPYTASPRSAHTMEFDDYVQLARVSEWSSR